MDELVKCVLAIDSIRASNKTEAEKIKAIAIVEERIKEIKKITGHQIVVGQMHIGR